MMRLHGSNVLRLSLMHCLCVTGLGIITHIVKLAFSEAAVSTSLLVVPQLSTTRQYLLS